MKTIFQIFLKTESLRKTCTELSKQGLHTKRYLNKSGVQKGGTHFTVSSLYHLLTNRALIGKREIGKKSGKIECLDAAWSAIIEPMLFEKARKLLAKNRHKRKPEEWKTYPYPLTDKILCGECGKWMGGKSAYGRNGNKHHHYEHPRQLHSDGLSHKRRCRMERVRAERVEEIILKFLKGVLSEPKKIEEMIAVYRKNKASDVPGLEGRIRTLTQEIASHDKKIENLTKRLADLPPEISAEPIYRQMKASELNKVELKNALTSLEAELRRHQSADIDPVALRVKLEGSIQKLEALPVEKRRPVLNSVIQFAELHPMKIRLGIIAPARKAGEAPATGSSSLCVGSCIVSNRPLIKAA